MTWGYAWLLVAWFGGTTISVPGIYSEDECKRLATEVLPKSAGTHGYSCRMYQMRK